MGTQYKLKVDRLGDVHVWEFFKLAAKLIEADRLHYSYAGSPGSVSIAIEEGNPDVEKMLTTESHLLYDVSTSVSRFSITLSRSGDESTPFGYDLLQISNSQKDYTPEENLVPESSLIQLSSLISKTFIPTVPNASALYRDPATFKTIMRSHQRMLEKMQETIAAVGEEAASARSKLEEEYWQKSSALLKEGDRRKRDFEAEVDRLRKRLAEEERALEERRKALDDRDNTHARRALHTNLKQRLAEHAAKFELTDDTKGRRKPIHGAVWVSAAALAAMIIFNSWKLGSALSGTTSTSAAIIMLLKPIGLTVALLGLLSWYLRWMNRWFERHADAEFQLKQFELDIDRASWVVETALEWRFAQNSAIPRHLLDNISRNLFVRGETDETADMHPADYLASALIGKASNVKLAVPGAEIELGPKALSGAGKGA